MECTLRPWRMKDAPALAAIINNPRIQDNLRDGLPYPYNVQDGEAFLRSLFQAEENSLFAFAITANDVLAGSICVTRQHNIHARTGELGYYIAQSFWGRGLATSAVRQMCEWVFAHTDLLRIFAEPFAFNAASQRVLEKCGFACEGTLRANAVKKGAVLDMKMYALIKTPTA